MCEEDRTKTTLVHLKPLKIYWNTQQTVQDFKSQFYSLQYWKIEDFRNFRFQSVFFSY